LGELVQIDGSGHAWFEDRGPPCTLLAFVDDATSRLMLILNSFPVSPELTFSDINGLRGICLKFGSFCGAIFKQICC